ncbi:hydroxysteroid 11-beta-dehydrogenase 1-like protein [Branchiostoma floridae]|uniref:Hydroxysteroid 11-beta-dehydrogenase 1-like protein n=1 Tax=Branchiostoma floridae TaxID=7739 RepID=A0A9J7LBZ9_BRAFL|nr:hydroxysteroid 11-beta-dehydrogenase 1-like protein [Branchiostoma floridae]
MWRLAWVSLTVLLGAVAAGVYWSYDGFDPGSLRGATVVITGCSSGIGEQMAYQYARLGAKILITARRENRLKEVVAKAKSLGAQEAHYVAGDMGKAEDCERTIQRAREKFGRLDYLVLNHVGSSRPKLQEKLLSGTAWDQDPDIDTDYFVDFLNVNLVSYVRLASLALPLLKESSGRIVVISSIGEREHCEVCRPGRRGSHGHCPRRSHPGPGGLLSLLHLAYHLTQGSVAAGPGQYCYQ